MSEQTQEQEQSQDIENDDAAVTEDGATVEATDEVTDESAQAPEFNELEPKTGEPVSKAELNRLNDVQVVVSAELGRAKVPIHELLQLGEGSVFELNRNVDGPVELIAQGVPLGNGDVVVVDGNFAIRIQEIYKS